jgi:hypothetical protein
MIIFTLRGSEAHEAMLDAVLFAAGYTVIGDALIRVADYELFNARYFRWCVAFAAPAGIA